MTTSSPIAKQLFPIQYDFDGVDIDWEFPGRVDRGGRLSDYQNLPLLIEAIRDAYLAAGKNYIVSLATPPEKSALQLGYDMVALAQHVDFFTLLSYEIHGIWDVPPLVAAATDLPFIQNAVDYILSLGVASNKILFGMSSFGHSYNLTNPSCNTAGCPFSGAGPGGCGGAPGSMPFFTIENIIESGSYDALRFHNASTTMEMVVNETIYLSFDNQQTWDLRAAYALEKCMRGYFWWALDQLPGPVPLTPRAGPKPVPPSAAPTSTAPTQNPTTTPTVPVPTATPTTSASSSTPSTQAPSVAPATRAPSYSPTTLSPSPVPTTRAPTSKPSTPAPTSKPPTHAPTSKPPTHVPTSKPTQAPTFEKTNIPTLSQPVGNQSVQAIEASAGSVSFPLWQLVTTTVLAIATCVLQT
jgi:hypothetical protein